MNKYLAWFITFNFINITWIFFRAKEWDDAYKILGAMFQSSCVLPQKYVDKFSILHNHFIGGKVYFNIDGSDDTTFWIIGAFITVLLLKNSFEVIAKFKPSLINSILFLLFSLAGILNLMHISEFLYFNF